MWARHHGMSRPQVADGGTNFNKEGIEIKIKQYNKSDGDRELLKCVSRTCENTLQNS